MVSTPRAARTRAIPTTSRHEQTRDEDRARVDAGTGRHAHVAPHRRGGGRTRRRRGGLLFLPPAGGWCAGGGRGGPARGWARGGGGRSPCHPCALPPVGRC